MKAINQGDTKLKIRRKFLKAMFKQSLDKKLKKTRIKIIIIIVWINIKIQVLK